MQTLMLECAVRAALIAVFATAVLQLLRVKAARVRHVVWAGVVVLMLVLPVWTAWGPRAVLRVRDPVSTPIAKRSAMPAESASARTPQQVSHNAMPKASGRIQTVRLRNWLTDAYLVGFCFLLARLVAGTLRAHRLIRRAANRGGKLTSALCTAPITVGWLNPVVILPESWQQWSSAKLSAILAHEDEHARRRDPLVQWLALLNRAVFWFHPLAWWLERRISSLAEEACDAAVLDRGIDPFEYSEYLLQIARTVQQAGTRVNVLGMAMPGTELPQRIRRILKGAMAHRISRARVVCLGVACATVSTVFTAGAVEYVQAHPSGQAVMTPQPQAIPTATLAIKPASPQILHKSRRILVAQAQTNPVTPSGGTTRQQDLEQRKALLSAMQEALDKLKAIEEQSAQDKARLVILREMLEKLKTLAEDQNPQNGPSVVQPTIEYKVDPKYSAEDRAAGIFGEVIVRLTVDPEGRVVKIIVTKSLGFGRDVKVMEAVKLWRFKPGLINGTPASMEIRLIATFSEVGVTCELQPAR
jgi:TonB family protein